MKKLSGVLLSTVVCATLASAGAVEAQFEAPKDTSAFDKVEVGLGANLTFNYQGLDHSYTPTAGTATELQAGFILPTADFVMKAKILSGFNMYMKTMLSSHHHQDTYAQGGYATMDNLDFVYPGFLSGFMDNATIKMGVAMPNIGDDHFSRTMNAEVMTNPFVNNVAVDLYMDAPFLEVLYRLPAANMFVLGGYTTGQVNPTDVLDTSGSAAPMLYGKIGFDKQLSEALRVRLTESVVYVSGTNTSHNSLFSGDKAGDLAALIYGTSSSAGRSTGWKPFSFNDLTVSMTNAFVKYNNTELTGMYQYATGSLGTDDVTMNHYTVGALQRFGANNRFYVAARYENAVVDNDLVAGEQELTQTQIALGWFLSKNAMMKIEYIKQERENIAVSGVHTSAPAEFDGYMIQAALSF